MRIINSMLSLSHVRLRVRARMCARRAIVLYCNAPGVVRHAIFHSSLLLLRVGSRRVGLLSRQVELEVLHGVTPHIFELVPLHFTLRLLLCGSCLDLSSCYF